MKLNAAEIRNATYQTHPIHRIRILLWQEKIQMLRFGMLMRIQTAIHLWLRVTSSTKRFAATELICQYFAYSRPERSPNSSVFKGTSTANSINRFLDINKPSSSQEVDGGMAQEIIDSYYFAEEYFDLDDGVNYAFSRNDKNGKSQTSWLHNKYGCI